ncbi:MAG: DUF4118 domain-containing protein, partial [Candidatus Rokuibacteriota bacterium]
VVACARRERAGRIVVGKPADPRWRELLFGSVVNELVRKSGEIDVYVTTGEGEVPAPLAAGRRRGVDVAGHAQAAAVVAVATAVAWLMFPYFELSNLAMVYLLGVVLAATRLGRAPSILAAGLAVAAFDFFFVPPYLTFRVADARYLVTFGVMLVVALVIGTLTVRIRQQAEWARQRERRTSAVYAMTQELARLRVVDDLLRAAVRHVADTFVSEVAIFLPDAEGELVARAGRLAVAGDDTDEREACRRAYERGPTSRPAGDPVRAGGARYVPLAASRGVIGVLAVRPVGPDTFVEPEQRHLLETFAAQTAQAIERATLAEEAHQARLRVESERLRNALLSSVSHDFRTPLATITGAASSLLDGMDRLDPPARRELLTAIHEEGERLNRLVHDLLDMTRLESGAVEVRKEWHPLEEIVGAALSRLGRRLTDRPVTTRLPVDLPLVGLDGVLLEQALINLLENALAHTPGGSPIEVSASAHDGAVRLEIADRGPGLPPGDETRLFEKFHRGRLAGPGGVGLGLAICRGIVEAHGGRISAENRPGGGAVFRIVLPLDTPPKVPPDDG